MHLQTNDLTFTIIENTSAYFKPLQQAESPILSQLNGTAGNMSRITVCLIPIYEYTCRHAMPCMYMHVYASTYRMRHRGRVIHGTCARAMRQKAARKRGRKNKSSVAAKKPNKSAVLPACMPRAHALACMRRTRAVCTASALFPSTLNTVMTG